MSPVTLTKAPRHGIGVFYQRRVLGKRVATVNKIDFSTASHTYILISIDRKATFVTRLGLMV
jgi:hypothetical protein